MQRCGFLCVISLVTLGALAGPAFANAAPQHLGAFGAWQAYRAQEGKTRICYAFSAPVDRRPAGLRRGAGYFFVTRYRTGSQTATEISLEFGYGLKVASTTLSVGDRPFPLMSQGEQAWLQHERQHVSAINALKREARARVLATSARGNQTEDVYDLRGFTKAYESIVEACRPGRR